MTGPIVLSSNEGWPVHIDPDDRRFFVLKVSDRHKGDKSYFKEIYEELKNEGLKAILHDLLNENISNFDPREIPQNIEAFEIKMLSVGSCEQYIFESLKVGCFDIGNATPAEEWRPEKLKESVFSDYRTWCSNEGIAKYETSNTLGRSIMKLVPSTDTKRSSGEGKRPRSYIFPTLDIARREFEEKFKVSSSIWE